MALPQVKTLFLLCPQSGDGTSGSHAKPVLTPEPQY